MHLGCVESRELDSSQTVVQPAVRCLGLVGQRNNRRRACPNSARHRPDRLKGLANCSGFERIGLDSRCNAVPPRAMASRTARTRLRAKPTLLRPEPTLLRPEATLGSTEGTHRGHEATDPVTKELTAVTKELIAVTKELTAVMKQLIAIAKELTGVQDQFSLLTKSLTRG